jgi:magnesium transporter
VAQIDKEVDQIDIFLHSDPDNSEDVVKADPTKPEPSSDSDLDIVDEKKDDASTSAYDEKPPLSPARPQQRVKIAMFRASSFPISLYVRRVKRFLKSKLLKTPAGAGVGEPRTPTDPAIHAVHKMVKIRRLVTSLTRLLSTKADLIGQIRKRLVTRGEWSLDNDPELYIHLGDILGQWPSHTSERYSECRCPRSHLVPTAGSCSLRMDVGPVTSNIPHSTAYPHRKDERRGR